MDNRRFKAVKTLRGEVTPPADKSISHRAVMFSALAKGTSTVRNLLRSEDTLSTMAAMRALGVEFEDHGDELKIHGNGLGGLREPVRPIDCGNSGTTTRLLGGLLSGLNFFSVLTGDESLSSRPMGRIVEPLEKMGARILCRRGRDGVRRPPLAIKGGGLNGIKYESPIASAQVKSALLLAGLSAREGTVITEPARSRDHTERLLPAMGAHMVIGGLTVMITPVKGHLEPLNLTVPGDFSSAAFFLVAASIVPGAELTIRNVGLNPTRVGLLDVLGRMGADIKITRPREVSGEPVGDLEVKCPQKPLKHVEVGSSEIPALIDEFPILCIAAAMARGKTVITGGGDLRKKESDRISAMAEGLSLMGVEVRELPDGIEIEGRGRLEGAKVESCLDHRIAMAFAVGSLVAEGETEIERADCVDISFPGFYTMLEALSVTD